MNNYSAKDEISDLNSNNAVFFSNLDENVTEKDLRHLLRECSIEQIKIISDWYNEEKSRGFGYIHFKDSGSVNIALSFNFTLVGQKPIRIMKFDRDEYKRRSGKANLYLRNLPEDIDELKLYNHFKFYGNVVSIKVKKDSYLKNRSFAYIQFENLIESEKALSMINNVDIFENGHPIEVYRFVPINLRYLLEYTKTLNEIKSLKDQEQFKRGYVSQYPYYDNRQLVYHHYNNLRSQQLVPYPFEFPTQKQTVQSQPAFNYIPVYHNSYLL